MDTFGITFFLVEKQMKLMSFKSRSSSNLSMLILIWNHSRSPTWSKSSPPDVNQLLMRRRPILSNFTTGKERALLRFCCLMWRQRRNRNRTDQQTGMCSPLMRFDLKGKKERALLKCLIALLWIGNIFYNERYSSDLCRSKYTLKPCFVSFEQLFHNDQGGVGGEGSSSTSPPGSGRRSSWRGASPMCRSSMAHQSWLKLIKNKRPQR